MSHQMTRWTDRKDGQDGRTYGQEMDVFLVHMPYFRRPGHISMMQYSIKALIPVLLTEIILVKLYSLTS